MVVPCIPCAVAAAPVVGPAMATFFGVGATAIAFRRSLKTKKKKKKTKKKKNNKSMKGGSLKKDKRKIHKNHRKCFSQCYKERDNKFKKPFGISHYDWYKSLSSEEKKIHHELHRKGVKCSKNCRKIEKQKLKDHKKKYSKEYREINKENKKNCCRCVYVKKGKSLRRVKGPYSHCSYDSDNCCKDKKTIVKSKK